MAEEKESSRHRALHSHSSGLLSLCFVFSVPLFVSPSFPLLLLRDATACCRCVCALLLPSIRLVAEEFRLPFRVKVFFFLLLVVVVIGVRVFLEGIGEGGPLV